MNVSQYSPNRRLEREAIGSLDSLPSVVEALRPAGDGAGEPHSEEPAIVRSGTWEDDRAEYRYAVDADGRCTIVKCDAKRASLSVPDAIADAPVRVIGGHSFSTCYGLSEIELPSGVTEIREHAFMNTALVRFRAPEQLRSVGAKAFFRCGQLCDVELNGELASIGEGAFRETALERLSVPASVSAIGRDAFKGANLVFSGDGRTLEIDEGNASFGLSGGALYEVVQGGLRLVQVLDEGITSYEGIGSLVLVGERAFADLRSLRHAEFLEGLLAIGEAAFKGCKELASVGLPDSVRLIGRRAFHQTSLESLRVPASLEAVGAEAFYTGGSVARDFKQTIRSVEVAPGNERFYIEEDTLCQRTGSGAVALLHFGRGSHITIPRSVTSIGPYAFLNSKQATHVTMHDRIGNIDVGGLDFGRALSTVVYETSGSGSERYVIQYPPGDASSQIARITFGGAEFDIEFAYAECDRAILHAQDLFTRSRMMLERLESPVYLSDRMVALFKSRLKTMVPAMVVEFGRNGYLRGLDSLVQFGMIDESNVQQAIDEAVSAGEVAVASRLVEVKRTRFDLPMFDFDL